jgi:protein subunit release factor A
VNEALQLFKDSGMVSIVIGILSGIFGIIVATLKIRNDLLNEFNTKNKDAIDNLSKFYDAKISTVVSEKEAMRNEIKELEVRLERKQDREIIAMKEFYDSELKHIRSKIEELKEEIVRGNSQLIDLITKMMH